VPVEIEILPSSTIFHSGESLGVVIQGSDLIKKGSNVITKNFGERRYQHMETVNKGDHIIYCGGKYDSHLLVPIIA
jgi:predicted acyl esterase